MKTLIVNIYGVATILSSRHTRAIKDIESKVKAILQAPQQKEPQQVKVCLIPSCFADETIVVELKPENSFVGSDLIRDKNFLGIFEETLRQFNPGDIKVTFAHYKWTDITPKPEHIEKVVD